MVVGAAYPRRIWTTNYDDLLEEAARQAGVAARALDPAHRAANAALTIAHRHGFLPPPVADRLGDADPRRAQVIFSEEEFHASTADVIGWTNRELHRLFDEHRLLVLGMSLDDPNVRRALAATAREAAAAAPRHMALLRPLALHAAEFPGVDAATLTACADAMDAARAWDWAQHGVEVVELPDYERVLPFLVRLRYERFGERPGALWQLGAERASEAIHPWRHNRQLHARAFLAAAVDALRAGFGLEDPAEVVEIGVFLVRSDAASLELTFRSRDHPTHGPRRRLFSADPDRPTGVAGRVFVSGDAVRVSSTDPLHNYGLTAAARRGAPTYAGIIAAPMIDWPGGGVPLGVVYVTTARMDGALFRLRPATACGPGGRSLDDLY